MHRGYASPLPRVVSNPPVDLEPGQQALALAAGPDGHLAPDRGEEAAVEVAPRELRHHGVPDGSDRRELRPSHVDARRAIEEHGFDAVVERDAWGHVELDGPRRPVGVPFG